MTVSLLYASGSSAALPVYLCRSHVPSDTACTVAACEWHPETEFGFESRTGGPEAPHISVQ